MSKSKKDKKYVNITGNNQSMIPEEIDENNEETEEYAKTAESGQEFQNIVQSGSIVMKNEDVTIQSITIIGQIEGHYSLAPQNKSTKYEHIIPLLAAVEENPEVDALLVILNTVGGDVEAGLAIAEMLASMSKPNASLVLGGGHSIGVPLAVSTQRTFIVPSATMTVHPVRMNGLVIGVEQSFTYFLKMQERINNFIIRHSKISDKILNDLMYNTGELATDVGSIVDGDQAKKLGLIDEIGGLSDALSYLRKTVKNNKKSRNSKASKNKKQS